jgi:tRNA A64-2'-O-ribosylphosphate transferase
MPDALSKTIPIWCAVLNRALFPSLAADPYHALYTPPQVVSPSEHAQIAALLPTFFKSFQALDLDLSTLRTKVSKPLRPFWITPDSDLRTFLDQDSASIFEDFHPVVCCTASLRVAGGELTTMGSSARDGGSYVYVQGAGDDTENWACGLTAELWWANVEKLMSTDEAELPGVIAELVRESEARALEKGSTVEATPIAPGVAVCTLGQLQAAAADDDIFHIALLPTVTPAETWTKSPTEMAVGIGKHKLASRNLRPALNDLCTAASAFFAKRLDADGRPREGVRVVVACESGRDASVAAALAVSMWCFNGDGRYRASDTRTIFTKDMVKVRLGVVMTAFPAANPNRASLQSVNSFLMDYTR